MNRFDPARYRNVRLPLDQAHGLPPDCYVDDSFYQRELQTIFERGWVMVGRVDRLPAAGHFFTAEFGRTRLILTRADDGALHALANTCRHRGAPLLQGQGQCKTIACPYHAWTYGLDGTLLGAPGMKESLNFDTRDYPLHRVRVDTWGGFIFVCLAADTPALADWLGDLPQRLAMYGFEHMRSARRVSYELACNWKVWVENFMEGYHIPTVHRSTLSRQKAINIPEDPGRGEYTAIYERHEGTRALLHGDSGFPPIETLSGDSSEGSRFILIYPATMLAIANDTMWSFEAHPLGAERTRIELTSCFPAQRFERDDFAALAANYFKRQDIVVREDNDISELQQRGLQSTHASPGRFSVKEKIVHALDNWVLDRVLNDVQADAPASEPAAGPVAAPPRTASIVVHAAD
jgi:choline monooxygenase